MPDIYGFTAGIAVCALVYGVRIAYFRFKEIADSMKESAIVASQINELAAKMIKEIDTFKEAAADNDKAANVIAKSAVQLQDVIAEIKAIMMPDPQPSPHLSLNELQDSFKGIEKELLAQGIDPETAKWKAAEYELERVANGDLTEISMSL